MIEYITIHHIRSPLFNKNTSTRVGQKKTCADNNRNRNFKQFLNSFDQCVKVIFLGFELPLQVGSIFPLKEAGTRYEIPDRETIPLSFAHIQLVQDFAICTESVCSRAALHKLVNVLVS
jgi:hypothetical protein